MMNALRRQRDSLRHVSRLTIAECNAWRVE
jgi:hypothetical protein